MDMNQFLDFVLKRGVSHSSFFLNQRVVRTQRIKKRVLSSLGWSLAFFNLFGFLVLLTDGRENAFVFLVMFLLSLLPLAGSLHFSLQISDANRFSSIFEMDTNGFIEVEDLARQTRKESGKVLTRLENLFSIGIFENCSLDRSSGKAGVRLSDASPDNRMIGFAHVKCPACGGTSRIRVGTVGKCEYCGSPITR